MAGIGAGLIVGPLAWYGPAYAATEPDVAAIPAARVAGADPARPGKSPTTRTVTLITGDAVHVTGERMTVVPAAGRRGIPMLTSRTNGHTFVVPADAEPLVRRGHLDRQLFDVTELLATGLDDASSRGVPLIVQYKNRQRTAGMRSALSAGGRKGRTFDSIDASAVTQPKASTASLWRALAGPPAQRRAAQATAAPGIRRVWLDRKKTLSLDVSAPQIQAPAAWAAGYTGRGVKVAVLDSGYDPAHPDLKDVVKASANFTTAPDVVDHFGHGTHVASIVAGSGEASNGRHRGVASGAELIVGKVCPDRGCPTSAILAGIEWAAGQGAKVVNMSFGGVSIFNASEPEEQAIERLTRDKGMLFVAAAGNDGPTGWVDSPSTAPSAISVASVDRQDRIVASSSRGPTLSGSLKPDVSAPGDSIVAAKAAGTDPEAADPYYTSMGGTSMATPHVSGAAAIVFSRYPDWSPEQVKAALLASARPAAEGDVYAQGAGVIDVAKALGQTVLATPAAVDFGGLSADPGDQRQTVTYRNSGAAPVTLTLDLQITGPGGRPLPQRFAVDVRELRVPAGGTASAIVTANMDGMSNVYAGGWLTASAGGVTVVRTAVGAVHRATPALIKMAVLNRAGVVDDKTIVRLINRETGRVEDIRPEQGEYPKVYVPEGAYDLLTAIFTPAGAAPASWTLHTRSALRVSGDMTLTVDARQGTRLSIDAGEAGTEQYATSVNLALTVPGGVENMAVSAGTAPDEQAREMYLLPGEAADHLTVTTRSTLVRPVDGDVTRSPVVYHLLLPDTHQLPGPAVTVDPNQLVTVHTQYAEQLRGELHQVKTFAWPPVDKPGVDLSAPSLPVASPLERTEYFTAAPVYWLQDVCLSGPDNPQENCLTGVMQDYPAGSRTEVRWNGAVFGPALLAYANLLPERSGEHVSLRTPLLTDAAPWHYKTDAGLLGTTKLSVNGELIESTDSPSTEFFVGERSGTFRVEVEAARPPEDRLRPTSRETVAWTFRSDHPGAGTTRMLPIMVVRFAPVLDLHNRAPAGQPFTLPVTVQRAPGMPATAAVTVEASYDDGTTCHRAEVAGAEDTWSARLTHPGSATQVSLRTTATDREGNRVEQTLIRAYALR
ncbi:S8 family peptidase [Couchioplanes caeruleus]|uniref:Peptidase S8/S53 domain-containing protein n=1 Tax=Couchioplanes caeruleus subsp. caeruleus TaxID=56427 RepID=A0A1K0FSZ4_9ACTN|nr:S8 family serine peptidase [Couchioplanes caeruleus]OJF15897.1 hypothetical protein BG844_01270 [Couchioplanes caeruleus subsp. caeruleus]